MFDERLLRVSPRHRWVQNGLSHQANHEGPEQKGETKLHYHCAFITREADLHGLHSTRCREHRDAPLVQELQPLREHQPHPEEAEIHQDELPFIAFTTLNNIIEDGGTTADLGSNSSSLSL